MLRALILFSVLSAILLLADQSASLSAVYCDEKGEAAGTLDGKQLQLVLSLLLSASSFTRMRTPMGIILKFLAKYRSIPTEPVMAS